MRELERRDPLLGAGVGVEEEQGGGKNLPARQAYSDIIKPVAGLAGAGIDAGEQWGCPHRAGYERQGKEPLN